MSLPERKEKTPVILDQTNFDQIISLLKGSNECLIFSGSTTDQIELYEQQQGYKLPESFKLFLQETDGAELYQSDVIGGVSDSQDGLKESLTTLTSNKGLPSNFIVFHDGGNKLTCFDINRKNKSGYVLVEIRNNNEQSDLSDESFLAWLGRLVDEHTD